MKLTGRDPFYREKLDEDKALEKSVVLTIRFNKEDLAVLKEIQKLLDQPKESTAIKTMFHYGALDVLHSHKTRYILGEKLKNLRNNERSGAIVD